MPGHLRSVRPTRRVRPRVRHNHAPMAVAEITPGEPRPRPLDRLARVGREARWVAAAALGFIALSIWWLAIDRRVPGGGDPGVHLETALAAAEMIRGFELGSIVDLGPYGDNFFYPPLVHLIGAIPGALGLGPVEDWATIAINLVFVPVLAAGTYLTGKLIYGARAGMLAALFALGSPIVLSLFHVFVLDAPLAAMTAITFAALLASERFSDRRWSVVAGALAGLALLTKTSAPLYLAGPLAAMLALGGWRQWRNLALAGLAALVVAGPYYLVHLSEVLDVGQESTVGTQIGEIGTAFDRDARLSTRNLSWYGWSAINEQYFVPLLLLFSAGFVLALRELRSRRHLPELLAGVVVTYVLLALVLSIRDARYIAPLVVYVAVIGTGWIVTVSGPWARRGGLAILALACAANVLASIWGGTPQLRIEAPGTDYKLGNDPGAFTFLEDRGYFVGAPLTDPLWHDLLAAAEREGVGTAEITDFEAPVWGTDPIGFSVVAADYGIRPADPAAAPADLVIRTWVSNSIYVDERGFPPACATIREGASVYDGEPLAVQVLVERRLPDGRLARWCEF